MKLSLYLYAVFSRTNEFVQFFIPVINPKSTSFPARFRRACWMMLLGLLQYAAFSQSAVLSGIIANASNGSPVTGAKIQIGSAITYSVAGGGYILSGLTSGTFQVSVSKAGFSTVNAPVTLLTSSTTTLNLSMFELTNPPGMTLAVIDSLLNPVGVKIVWELPRGPYEILTDDGIVDNFVVWATQGNMNAVRFTPVGYPARITGGKVHIGTPGNYPSGSNPLVPFQISVYDASGPGGAPGTLLAGPFDILPTALGWVDFSISNPPEINSGSFCIVMIQGGNAPNAAGLSVDETSPQLRSFSRFVTGNGQWLPASGNFMIRALVEGPGGPLFMSDSPQSLVNYSVYRLKQGEEQNSSVWTGLGTTDVYKMIDNSWLSLPCGPYRWGVRANYSGNRISTVTFSNVIGKCWTRSVTIHVDLSCPTTPVSGTKITMKNLVYPDTVYTAVLDTSGQTTFPTVWKGSYEIQAVRFGYQPFSQFVSVDNDTTYTLFLLQDKTPPEYIRVNDSSLLVKWARPRPVLEIFTESWGSASFATNGWVTDGGPNWGISTAFGNPAPSAFFNYSPAASNYSQTLTSRDIQGENSAILKLAYDVRLDNFGTTTLNQLAVELWDGNTWHLLKNYTNAGGDISWTAQDLDISAYSDIIFKIRFRAYGVDSYDINGWNIDNIRVTARESVSIAGSCVMGYNVFVDNIQCAFTTDTSWYIPPALAGFGTMHTACVNAAYASGPSSLICKTFTSHYLSPPAGLQGVAVEDAAYITWNKPQVAGQPGVTPPGLMGYILYRNGEKIDSIAGADTLSYYDLGLYPGNYAYEVSAKYDLTAYGFTGIAESGKAGPVNVLIDYGRPLPFFEGWDHGNFSFNGWGFSSAQGNWSISTSEGNPLPAATFSWEPVKTGYSFGIESTIINATSVTCSKIWLDFDLRLQDRNLTGTEILSVEIFYNDTWHGLEQNTNEGSLNWATRHIDISAVKGKAFRIRFRAHGVNSGDISMWEVDNINAYAVCKPPLDAGGVASGSQVTLTWKPPVCADGLPLNEGFEEPEFPPLNWEQEITNSTGSWFHSDASSPVGVHSGNYAATISWDYTHQDEWLIAKDILVSGDLVFWSNAYQGSVHLDHYYVKISEDDGATWQTVLDLSALPPYPSSNGYNQWNTPYNIDLSVYLGQVVDIAWQAVDGDGQGLWYAWSIDDCSVGGHKISMDQPVTFQGYDVYRQDDGSGPWVKINTAPVPDTLYIDNGLTDGSYAYYITLSMEECSSSITTDTLVFDIVTGFNEREPLEGFVLYPNPAGDYFIIRSAGEITDIEIMDLSGKIIYHQKNSNSSEIKIIANNFPTGLFFVKIISSGKSHIRKLLLL